MKPLNILIIAVLIYLVWAMWHHHRDKSLTLPILIEYLLTALLVLTVLSGSLL
ncbi:hypothetical protein HYU96_01525 [Candidatus Daviesbacteria bacterium]|nr:hypothetical protein [Candidatus Daviesbacteria bacterium]